MNAGILTLLLVYGIVILDTQKRKGTIFDAFFFVMTPYVAIILINNLLMIYLGFRPVSDNTILLHLYALIFFYAGTRVGDYCGYNRPLKVYLYNKRYPNRLIWSRKASPIKAFLQPVTVKEVDIQKVKLITAICQIIIALDIVTRVLKYGAVNFVKGGEYGQASIPAHLMLLIIPLSILLLEDFYKNKDKTSLVLVGSSIIFIFMTFIKYNVISTIIGIFMYFAIRYPKVIVKFGLLVLAVVFGVFILTYVVSFIIYGTQVEAGFYIKHLWSYLVGGTLNINMAQLYLNGRVNEFSIFSWLFQMLTSLPNMFTNKLFGFSFTDYAFAGMLPELYLGAGGTTSNVVSLLGAGYIQSNDFFFGIFVFLWGMLVQWVYVRVKESDKVGVQLAGSIFLAFNMLSFFASFFELPGPWETIIWGLLVGYLIRGKKKEKTVDYLTK